MKFDQYVDDQPNTKLCIYRICVNNMGTNLIDSDFSNQRLSVDLCSDPEVKLGMHLASIQDVFNGE